MINKGEFEVCPAALYGNGARGMNEHDGIDTLLSRLPTYFSLVRWERDYLTRSGRMKFCKIILAFRESRRTKQRDFWNL